MNAKLEKTAKVGHLVFAVITTCLTFLITGAVAYGVNLQRLNQVEQKVQEANVKADTVQLIREDMRSVKTDIEWIKSRVK